MEGGKKSLLVESNWGPEKNSVKRMQDDVRELKGTSRYKWEGVFVERLEHRPTPG